MFGGNGFNSDYPVEKLMRDAKIYQVNVHSCLKMPKSYDINDIQVMAVYFFTWLLLRNEFNIY